MSTPPTSEPALLLRSAPRGENFLKLDLLSPESGLRTCLKRVARKATAKPAPDLFDTAHIELAPPRDGGSLRFVRDYLPARRRSRIGANYPCLSMASAFSQLLIRNGAHLPDTEALFELSERTFDAFDSGSAPPIVLLKGLYLLLRDEGFPVRESWGRQLPRRLREPARQLLNQPVPDTPDRDSLHACEALREDLANWIRRETDILLPDTLR